MLCVTHMCQTPDMHVTYIHMHYTQEKTIEVAINRHQNDINIRLKFSATYWIGTWTACPDGVLRHSAVNRKWYNQYASYKLQKFKNTNDGMARNPTVYQCMSNA